MKCIERDKNGAFTLEMRKAPPVNVFASYRHLLRRYVPPAGRDARRYENRIAASYPAFFRYTPPESLVIEIFGPPLPKVPAPVASP